MSQVQRSRPGTWEQSDVARVVSALQQAGPMPLEELMDHPFVADWQADRVNDAVVAAWSHDLISIDPRDLLVAL